MSTSTDIEKEVYTYPELNQQQASVIQEAIGILETRLTKGAELTEAQSAKHYCQLQLAGEQEEHFGCLFLDTKHRLITFERLFQGTIGTTAVYPRVVLKRVVQTNAAAVIFTHNHPSGCPEPSAQDIKITQQLIQLLNTIDVRVLDHIVVGTEGVESFAERGII